MLHEIDIPASTPWVYDLGIRDGSTRNVPLIARKDRFIPMHFMYASRGPAYTTYLTNSHAGLYGAETFQVGSKWYNHQSAAANTVIGKAIVGIKRIIPEDAKAAICNVSLVLEAKTIPTYQRDSAGRYVIDLANDLPIPSGTVDGYTYRWEVEDVVASGATLNTLLTQGASGPTTGLSTPPPAPTKGTLVPPSGQFVFEVETFENQSGGDLIIPGEITGASLLASGLTAVTPAPTLAADAVAKVVGDKYIYNQHMLLGGGTVTGNMADPITLAGLVSEGLIDEGFIPTAADGVIVPVGKYVSFGGTIYENVTAAQIEISADVYDKPDLITAGFTVLGAFVPSVVTTFPFFTLEYNGESMEGNNTAIRINVASDDQGREITEENRLLFGLSIAARPNKHSSPETIKSVLGDLNQIFTWEPNAMDSLRREITFKNVLDTAYSNTTDFRYPWRDDVFRKVIVHQASIDQALETVSIKEKSETFGMDWSDFQVGNNITLSAIDLKYLSNVVTGRNSNSTPYVTLVADSDPMAIHLGRYNNIFCNGGADGTMSEQLFETAVNKELLRYADPEDEVQDYASSLESDFFDSGFSLDVKENMANFIAIRKDRYVTISTYENDANLKIGGASDPTYVIGDEQSLSDELAIFALLRTRLNMVPESSEFDTPVTRATVMVGSGVLADTTYKTRVPTTFWLMDKTARYMGGKSGTWKTSEAFDVAPGHIITNMTNLSRTWSSKLTRDRLWNAGMTFHLTFDAQHGVKRAFVPAIKTVYEDHTSVLTGYFFCKGAQAINRSVHRAWRNWAGSVKLGGPRLARAINEDISTDLADSFDGMFVIKPEAQFGNLDKLRGYSITVPVKQYSNIMNTAWTHYIDALRMDDLGSSS